MKNLLIVILCCLPSFIKAQILFSESYTIILDTTKHIKGSFLPSFKYQNQKEDLIEFTNQADITLLVRESAFTFANNIAITKFGGETILSGGYIYGEFRKLNAKAIALETYAQVHWAEARGLDRKYAGGVNARFKLHKSKKWGLFVGVGPFYEYEKWNFNGIADMNLIPGNELYREQENIKMGSYVSLKYTVADFLFIDISGYYQSKFDEWNSAPRLASSSRITYNFTQALGFAVTYQNIYDPAPLVPINKTFHKLVLGFSITF